MADNQLLKGNSAMLVLGLLQSGDKYGYEMIQALAVLSNGAFDLKEGTLYPILHSLEQRGSIEAYWQDSDKGRRRRYYRLTRDGQRELQRRREEWNSYCMAVSRVMGGECFV